MVEVKITSYDLRTLIASVVNHSEKIDYSKSIIQLLTYLESEDVKNLVVCYWAKEVE
jgi:hypothetical protein